MPTLIVENVPAEVYEYLQKRAAARQRTLPEELLNLLEQVLRADDRPTPRLPEFISSEELSAPCDLPRSSEPVPVVAYSGQPRLPAHDRAQAGLSQLKQAILDHLAAHPEGCRNVEVAEALGIHSDFEGDQRDYLSWSILGLLVGEEKVRYQVVGKQRRYFVHSQASAQA